ncbi:MAG: acetyl-CoA carboxylase carboxyltransferase subunit alpha [Candidatus Eisenbacteria bacterium]|nr:acetyl-CoA carboxylase carboxyltransferase subunit alpha [Candidatus Latescibacterota bacterium]MBD3301215.1 acetyl-CoA carboxylase carboxyltransferase subunit alpha [Candidatus Eisenbacteria bacterium]
METGWLEFEKPIIELEQKIEDLRAFADKENLEFSEELRNLEERAAKVRDQVYANLSSWQRVQIARHPRRPYTLDYVGRLFTDFVELHGDRRFSEDPAIVAGIARFEGRPVVVVGHQKGRNTKENLRRNFGMPHPEGYRKALRIMQLGEKFANPILCFIDTPGAYPGIGAEERGQAEAIAFNLLRMASIRTPILVLVIGEGGSGGALALALGDEVLMFENAIYSVISPEGCAAILWKDQAKAQTAAEALRLTAPDLAKLRVISRIVPEPLGGAHRDPPAMAETLRKEIRTSLERLSALSTDDLLRQRRELYRKMGVFAEGS